MNELPLLNIILNSGPAAWTILSILLIMSLVSWGVILTRYLHHKKIRKANAVFYNKFQNINEFVELDNLCKSEKDSPLKFITMEVLSEARKLSRYVSYESIFHRSSLLEESIRRGIEAERISEDKNLSLLALASSLSPFIGLLGTVWGIMNSFFEIGQQGSAELAVVAPGIAAALITTIGGLMVAIPASAAYNTYVDKNNKNEIYYSGFGSQVLSLFKRGDLAALEEV